VRREIPTTLRWVALALLGLLVAIAVGIAASELTSRRIGLSSEPIRAGDALAPAPRESPRERKSDGGPGARPEGTTKTPPQGTAASPPPATTGPETTGEPETTTSDGGEDSEGSDD
jgi:hypothetical protein